MHTITQSFGLLWNALFLEAQAYAAMRDEESPIKKGLVILIILGLALAVAGIVGATLEWASGPSVDDLQETIWELNQQAPWWGDIESQPEAIEMFEEIWDQVWQIVRFTVPTPASSLSGL